MKFVSTFTLLAAIVVLSCCRSAQVNSNVPFDPLSLGQGGTTLKAYLDQQKQPAGRRTPTITRVTIEADLPSFNKKGTMIADKITDAAGHISYEMKSFTGDNIVKTKVIGAYLSAEQEASENQVPAINGDNYRFRFKRKDNFGDRVAVIFELVPLRKIIGLFKGELWLEENTGRELRQTGRLVKNPSVIFKTADLTRDFEFHCGENYLASVDYQATTRVVGKVSMKMKFERPRQLVETVPPPRPSQD
jgi:hypothetical protein